MTKSSMRARRAASRTSSSEASDPMRMFSRMLPLVRNVFWNTTATLRKRSS